jgi:hypothetical protein
MRKYTCGYCNKDFTDPRHEELEEERADLMSAMFMLENHMLKKRHSPDLFFNDLTLKKYRRKLKKLNEELENGFD